MFNVIAIQAKIIQNTLLRFAVDRIPSLVHSLLIWLEATDSLEYLLVTMQSVGKYDLTDRCLTKLMEHLGENDNR